MEQTTTAELEALAFDLAQQGHDARLELGHPVYDRLLVDGRLVAQARKQPPFGGRRLCAHADLNGEGMHWLEPGERCAEAVSA